MLRATLIRKYEWEDVPYDKQRAALARMINDYDATGSWVRGNDKPLKELKAAGCVTLPGRKVLKAKIYDGNLDGRARWTPKGFHDRGAMAWECESPTANRLTHRILSWLGFTHGWSGFTADFSEACFHLELIPDDAPNIPWVEIPEDDPEYQPGYYRQLRKWVPGTKQAPKAWYDKLKGVLETCSNCVKSKLDPCLFWFVWEDRRIGYVAIHVDDVKGRIIPKYMEWLRSMICEQCGLPVGLWTVLELGVAVEFCGERETEHEDRLTWDQEPYIEKKLEEIAISPQRAKKKDADATEEERSEFRRGLGQLGWVTSQTRPDKQYETSYAAGQVNHLKVKHLIRLQKAIKHVKHDANRWTWTAPAIKGKIKLVGIVDAGEGENSDGGISWERAQAGMVVGFMEDSAPKHSRHVCPDGRQELQMFTGHAQQFRWRDGVGNPTD